MVCVCVCVTFIHVYGKFVCASMYGVDKVRGYGTQMCLFFLCHGHAWLLIRVGGCVFVLVGVKFRHLCVCVYGTSTVFRHHVCVCAFCVHGRSAYKRKNACRDIWVIYATYMYTTGAV